MLWSFGHKRSVNPLQPIASICFLGQRLAQEKPGWMLAKASGVRSWKQWDYARLERIAANDAEQNQWFTNMIFACVRYPKWCGSKVEGPGFNQPGPLLEEVGEEESLDFLTRLCNIKFQDYLMLHCEMFWFNSSTFPSWRVALAVLVVQEPIVLYALSPIDDSGMLRSEHGTVCRLPAFLLVCNCLFAVTVWGKFCDICLKPSQTVKQSKYWLALRMPGLKAPPCLNVFCKKNWMEFD